MKAKDLARWRVTEGEKFRLADFETTPPKSAPGDDKAEAALANGVKRLAQQQELLYAQGEWALLAIFQGMDASGKDGTIRHVMTGVNPQGIEVSSFKQPGPTELSHDFLWRIHQAVPQRGRIGIFNRSQYEEVMVCRVHPELLDHQHLPDAVRGKKFWQHRFEDIAAFERYLSRQGIIVLKFYLNLSRAEQKRRLLARIDHAHKNWKFSAADLAERAYWDAYRAATEEAIAGTASECAPWYVVPADDKDFAHLVVVEAMVAALEDCNLRVPAMSADDLARLQDARAALEAE
jgi:PPK2 family polyphosphate:nucleotide phosphotransferase